jgi:hypothetical protein
VLPFASAKFTSAGTVVVSSAGEHGDDQPGPEERWNRRPEQEPRAEELACQREPVAARHGRHGAETYTGAKEVKVSHSTLHPGDRCPSYFQPRIARVSRTLLEAIFTGHSGNLPSGDKAPGSPADAIVVAWFDDVLLLLFASRFLPVDSLHCFWRSRFSR